MSVKMNCPHCTKTLSVPEKALGKTAACPSCHQPITIPNLGQPSLQAGRVDTPPSWSDAGQSGGATSDSARPLPAGMPPMPDGDSPAEPPSDPLAFLRSEPIRTPVDGLPKMSEARGSAAVAPVRISALRHPKESVYFTIAAIAGTLGWLCLIPIILLFSCVAIPLLVVVGITLWITQQRYKANMMGHSVRVSQDQYPEIFEIVDLHCRALGLAAPPAVFVVSSDGEVNAFARRVLKDKYVLLLSELIDVMLAHGSTKELSSIIGHELGHHAAGHTAWWKETLVMPAMCIPFLGGAYLRACELTADRIGLHLCGDKDAACRGLTALACGSKVLSPRTNVQAFKDQERAMPGLGAFLNDVYSFHPRLTKRVMALEDAARLVAH
jgi:Zn-dependent protease with chaperone function